MDTWVLSTYAALQGEGISLDPTIAGYFKLEFDGLVSGRVSFDASPSDLRETLAALPGIPDVAVSRVENNQGGYNWTMTFFRNIGDMPAFLVAEDALRFASDGDGGPTPPSSAGPRISLLEVARGYRPIGYGRAEILIDSVEEAHLRLQDKRSRTMILDPSAMTPPPDLVVYTIKHLQAKEPYFFRASFANAEGYGYSLASTPISVAPLNIPPEPPRNLRVGSNEGQRRYGRDWLGVDFEAPARDGGRVLDQYLVEFDKLPTFDSVADFETICDEETLVCVSTEVKRPLGRYVSAFAEVQRVRTAIQAKDRVQMIRTAAVRHNNLRERGVSL